MTHETSERPRPELDPKVLARARRGDERAFAELIRLHDEPLRGLAFRLLGDRDRMDDALQEAYVKAFRALPAFRGDAGIGTWLYRIVYNACLDELKRDRQVVPLDRLRDRPAVQPSTFELLSARQSLARALDGLSVEDRAAVLLVDAHGLDYREAAQVLGVPEGTIASRLNRARAALRRSLDSRVEGAGGR
jgi:RNA polymerase sigma-70 factor (ECF subfamily)